MQRHPKLPNAENLVKGRVYKIRCRNLSHGVWDGNKGFIGIREKFRDLYLFTEYHYDLDDSFGTVWYAEDLGVDVPAGIPIEERLGTVDRDTDRPVDYKDKFNEDGSRCYDFIEGEPYGWHFTDVPEIEHRKSIHPCSVHNDALFNFLQEIEKQYPWKDEEYDSLYEAEG